VDGNIKIPKIIYVANKSEDGDEGDILGDFYMKFPNAATQIVDDPIFISAEHGDGMQDLYGAILNNVP
jgi:predicted GTPase